MRGRRTFLSSLAVAGLCGAAAVNKALASPRSQRDEPSPVSSRSERDDPSPPARATPLDRRSQEKSASASALAIAATYRRFDPKLTDDELETIARSIDDNAKAAATLNPKKKRLKNSDEPVTVFTVHE